ncbi:hypothetical protein [Botrimarina sp.]|uniref:hypothetical protein n=1 Tax=Botrimarina sp. TaxID=2795802 RepID=UPI0032EF263F
MKLKTLTLALAAVLVAATGQAATINAIIGNFDVAFDGQSGEITDFNRPNGGNLDPAESRTFSSFEVVVDGVSEVMFMNPPDALFGDLLVDGLGPALQINSLVQNVGGDGADGFGFDFFTPGGDELRIAFDDISYSLVTTPIPSLNFFTFFADANVVSQNLPKEIQFDGPALLSFTATRVMVMSDDDGASSVIASGVMTVTGEGTIIPEPTSAALALLGLAGAVRRRV